MGIILLIGDLIFGVIVDLGFGSMCLGEIYVLSCFLSDLFYYLMISFFDLLLK